MWKIKLIRVQYFQCSVFIGACALIDSELVIPCDVNRGYELWSSVRDCWPILDQSCVAANASSGSGWMIFPGYGAFSSWVELVAQPSLPLRGFRPLWQLRLCCLWMHRPSLHAPRVTWFIWPYLWFTMKVWQKPTSLYGFSRVLIYLEQKPPAPWFRKS